MQQKLAAVLAVDVVGGPGAGGADPVARELLTIQYELVDPTIGRYGGRVFALMPATTLVEFAEATNAVGCGLEIQRGMAERAPDLSSAERIGLRIGIDAAEVITVSGDLRGPAVTVAQSLARVAPVGAVALSGRVARQVGGRKLRAESVDRGVRAVAGVGRLEVVELRPIASPKTQSPWILRRRWTWIAALAAVVLLAGALLVLWRPVREWLLPVPVEANATAAPAVASDRER